MSTKTRTKKFGTEKDTSERSERSSKNDYAAKLETIRRKEVRNHKQSFNKARSAK